MSQEIFASARLLHWIATVIKEIRYLAVWKDILTDLERTEEVWVKNPGTGRVNRTPSVAVSCLNGKQLNHWQDQSLQTEPMAVINFSYVLAACKFNSTSQ